MLVQNGLKWKPSVMSWSFPQNRYIRAYELKKQLDADKYKLSKYTQFFIADPKPRIIKAQKFRDRVVQKAMCTNGLYDDLMRCMIYDSCACQKGKGVLFAKHRMNEFLHLYSLKHGKDGWVLKIDVHHFFDSIPHKQLKKMVGPMIRNEDYRKLVFEIIDSYPDPGIGLGCQVNQLLANVYLNGIDHLIKEKLQIKYYVRYADDMVLMHEDKEFLQYCLSVIEAELKKLGLRINDKTSLQPLKNGVKFLKTRFIITDSMKIIWKTDMKTFRRWRRHFRKTMRRHLAGEFGFNKVMECFISWRSRLLDKHYSERGLIKKVETEMYEFCGRKPPWMMIKEAIDQSIADGTLVIE